MTVEQATTALEGVDLAVNSKGTEEYSTTIPAGRVISVASTRGTIRPGDSVALVVSKGPELIAIPDVTDMTIAAARDALEELGFTVTVETDIPARLWGQSWAKAGSTDPASGTQSPKGSTVILRGAL
jgi:serine/threonine-protein kinase